MIIQNNAYETDLGSQKHHKSKNLLGCDLQCVYNMVFILDAFAGKRNKDISSSSTTPLHFGAQSGHRTGFDDTFGLCYQKN